MITSNIHSVTSISISMPKQLEESKSWTRSFTFVTQEGMTVQITAFADDRTELATKEALA